MQDISLHILDIIENSINAEASRIEVTIVDDPARDLRTVTIRDNGRGMDDAMRARALDPFFTSKPGKRVGLGIPLLAQSAREAGGELTLESNRGEGTHMVATFTLSHPDIKPLGDVEGTIGMMRYTHPEIEFVYDMVEIR